MVWSVDVSKVTAWSWTVRREPFYQTSDLSNKPYATRLAPNSRKGRKLALHPFLLQILLPVCYSNAFRQD